MRPTSKWHFFLGLPNGSPEIAKVGTPTTLGPITLCANLRLRWGLTQSSSPRRELFKDMSHATCTQGNWVDSRLLVVGGQIANLTPGHSFGHNLCFKCSNGSCKPILEIYVFNSFPMVLKNPQSIGFWPLQLLFEHSKVHRDSNSQGGKLPWECEGSFPHTFFHFQAFSLGLQPCKPLPWSQAQG